MNKEQTKFTAVHYTIPRIIMPCGYEPTDEEILTPGLECPCGGKCGFEKSLITALSIDTQSPVLDTRTFTN